MCLYENLKKIFHHVACGGWFFTPYLPSIVTIAVLEIKTGTATAGKLFLLRARAMHLSIDKLILLRSRVILLSTGKLILRHDLAIHLSAGRIFKLLLSSPGSVYS